MLVPHFAMLLVCNMQKAGFQSAGYVTLACVLHITRSVQCSTVIQ